VIASRALREGDLRAVDDQVAQAIAEAVKFAEASSVPAVSELTTDVYVTYPA
jgi:TPP-dependent pyruvate/acetoin dehydrogenase alpha subunit